jgi:hypothetical protein
VIGSKSAAREHHADTSLSCSIGALGLGSGISPPSHRISIHPAMARRMARAASSLCPHAALVSLHFSLLRNCPVDTIDCSIVQSRTPAQTISSSWLSDTVEPLSERCRNDGVASRSGRENKRKFTSRQGAPRRVYQRESYCRCRRLLLITTVCSSHGRRPRNDTTQCRDDNESATDAWCTTEPMYDVSRAVCRDVCVVL